MNRKIVARFLAVIPFAVAGWLAYTQAPPTQLKLNKIKDDLYEIEGDGGNVAVYITSEGVIMVDDKFDADHDQILANIKSVTNQPVKYILSTHYHQDHSGGNGKFLGTAQIISTQNARANIINKVQQGNVQPPPVQAATVTYNDETAVFLGGKEVRAKHYGRGHTNGDAIIYFPALKVIHTGDLMAGNSPLIDYPGGGSVVEWTKTLDAAMNSLDFDTVIPGHGAVTTKANLLAYRNNVEKLRNRAQGMIRQGKSADEVFAVMTKEFNWAPDGLQKNWSIPGMMKELK
jgi:cyclase